MFHVAQSARFALLDALCEQMEQAFESFYESMEHEVGSGSGFRLTYGGMLAPLELHIWNPSVAATARAFLQMREKDGLVVIEKMK